MQNLPFLFSDRWQYRLPRHLVFWIIALFGLGLVGLSVRPLFNIQVSSGSITEQLIQPLLYLPGQLFLVYILLYWVIPRYLLRSRYMLAATLTVLLGILSGFIAAISSELLHQPFLHWIGKGDEYTVKILGKVVRIHPEPYGSLRQHLPYDFLIALRATLNVAGFAVALKLLKHWYQKEYRNNILQKEKLDAELQSLKAQLHPHFLFNTLNNIYSIAEDTSPQASEMLLKLSAILRYILYECNHPRVPLSQELTLIRDYLDLEKIRYSELDLSVHLPAETGAYTITPLLLLPLVENCFKHGASQLLEQPWINIDVDIRDGWLLVKLINGRRPVEEMDTFREGIGLSNLRKRLELLYPGKHELSIVTEQELFVLNLKVELQNKANGEAR